MDTLEENSLYGNIELDDETVVLLSKLLYDKLSSASKSVFDEHFTIGDSRDQFMYAVGRSQINEVAVRCLEQLIEQEEG